jgi:osmotically-inducible protein OsmY
MATPVAKLRADPGRPDSAIDQVSPRVLLVGENTAEVGTTLQSVDARLERVADIDAALAALGPLTIGAILMPPLTRASLPRAVAALREEAAPEWPILAVAPDGISDLDSRRLYRQGATAVFEWPRESRLFARLALEMLGADRRRSPATEADRALEKALGIRLNLIPETANSDRQIRIRVREGLTKISGRVEALWVKDRIERSAASMPGLVSVNTRELAVAASGLADAEIARNVRGVLRGATSVEERTLTATLNDGHAILMGTVSSVDEFERLRELVANAHGVRSITDRTERAPRKKRRDRDVARRLQNLLSQVFPDEPVRVTILSQVAVLTGQAARLETKQRIRTYVSRDDAINRVVNKIEVGCDGTRS